MAGGGSNARVVGLLVLACALSHGASAAAPERKPKPKEGWEPRHPFEGVKKKREPVKDLPWPSAEKPKKKADETKPPPPRPNAPKKGKTKRASPAPKPTPPPTPKPQPEPEPTDPAPQAGTTTAEGAAQAVAAAPPVPPEPAPPPPEPATSETPDETSGTSAGEELQPDLAQAFSDKRFMGAAGGFAVIVLLAGLSLRRPG